MNVERWLYGIVYAEMDDEGLRHQIVAVPWRAADSFGALGRMEDGWLVVESVGGRAYLFQGGLSFLHWAYVAEKFDCGERRARVLTALICAATGRPGTGVADDPNCNDRTKQGGEG